MSPAPSCCAAPKLENSLPRPTESPCAESEVFLKAICVWIPPYCLKRAWEDLPLALGRIGAILIDIYSQDSFFHLLSNQVLHSRSTFRSTYGAKIPRPTALVRVVWGLSRLRNGPCLPARPHSIEKEIYHNSDICKPSDLFEAWDHIYFVECSLVFSASRHTCDYIPWEKHP